jgi:pyruvate ferredoxin oxidoreductase beta subunit
VENGAYTINKKFTSPKPVSEYLKLQGRFRHLGVEEIAFLQTDVNKRWDRLLRLEQAFGKNV